MGEPIILKICIEADQDIEKAEVMYSIYNPYAVLIASSNSRFAMKDVLRLKKGKNWFEVKYDSLPISCGLYSMNVRVWDVNEKDMDWVEKAYTFEIVESDIYGTGRFYKDASSILAVPHQWSVK